MEKKGIKELKELIAGLKEAVKAVKEIRDIVKSFKDDQKAEAMTKAFQLIKGQVENLEVYTAAFTGLDEVKVEAKDLDSAEVMELMLELVEAVKEIEKA